MKPVGPQEVESSRKIVRVMRIGCLRMVEARALAVRAMYDLEKRI